MAGWLSRRSAGPRSTPECPVALGAAPGAPGGAPPNMAAAAAAAAEMDPKDPGAEPGKSGMLDSLFIGEWW